MWCHCSVGEPRRFPPDMMAAWDDQYKRTTMEGEMFSFATKLFCETKLTCISVHYAGIGGRIFTNRRWLHAFFLNGLNKPFIDDVSGDSFIVGDHVGRVFVQLSVLCHSTLSQEGSDELHCLTLLVTREKKFTKAYLLVFTYS